MTQPFEPIGPSPASPPPAYPPPDGPNWRGRAVAVTVAAMVLVGAGVGVGILATAGDAASLVADKVAGSGSTGVPTHGKSAGGEHAGDKNAGGKNGGGKAGVDPARAAWSHKYGLDRSTMPNLSPASSGSSEQQAAATDLLRRTEAATAKYSDLTVAKAAGYDLQASLAKKERKSPRVAEHMKRIDAGAPVSGADMPMLHVGNKSKKADGKVLDPSAPETLMYGYQGDGKWMLMGVMYTATESYPQAPPDPGGPVTRWHYHDKSGAKGLMMHIFFVPGNDLARAYAAEMT